MQDNEIIWRIAGGSGDGIDSTGTAFSRYMMRHGLNVTTHRHYPSRIRGGHTFFEVRATNQDKAARADDYNVLLSLGDSFARAPDGEAIYGNEEVKPLTENLDGLKDGGVVIYDTGVLDADDIPGFEEKVEEKNLYVYPVDLRGIAKEMGREVMRNTAGVGATAAVIDMDLDPMVEIMSENMGGDILEQNEEILRHTHDKVKEEFDEFPDDVTLPDGELEDEDRVLLSGSHGIAYGAIDSGCRFISGYPMTPWTDVFSIMSSNMPDLDGIAEQVEDEIAAASLAIGASHAGAKAMSGSSGGGFALMSEPLGLAGMTETPLVLVEAMRGGPSTGLPTKTEQSDLEHVLYTSHGDSMRVVFAPGNVEEAYEQTRQAFDIAYSHNIPCIVLYDKSLSGGLETVPAEVFDNEVNYELPTVLDEDEIGEYKREDDQDLPRFKYDAEDGVSMRTIPGQKDGRFKTTGNEHDEYGYISEDPVNRVKQMDRRMERFDSIKHSLHQEDRSESNQSYEGPEDAKYGLICFGSNKGPVEAAVGRLVDDGYSVKSLKVSDMIPFPVKEVKEFLDSVEHVVVVENNATAQFRHHVQRELGSYGVEMDSLLKYDGTPFRPEIVENGFKATIGEGTLDPEFNTRIQEQPSRKSIQHKVSE
ncbi:MAG: 2-oxoacid:acceptor oxidoreductase subunit alpha [Halobacteria archaeon]